MVTENQSPVRQTNHFGHVNGISSVVLNASSAVVEKP